ncbi:MAG: hypothetical protein E7222_10465 [Clostridiales bacterium]|nr:hypothetical protein [Clostridiales bacterium]
MKYVLIPVKEGTATSGDGEMVMPAMVMNLISAIILSVWATSEYTPNLHGWGRFVVCTVAVFTVLFLTMVPIVGTIICVANAILWIILFWALFGGISVVWLKWSLRVLAVLFIVAFESAPILCRLS